MKYCVELGNDVNAADNRGYTALHGAAYLGNNDMVNYLVSKGAKVDAKSKAGDTVADMANGPTRFGQPHPETWRCSKSWARRTRTTAGRTSAWWRRRRRVYERPLTAAEQARKGQLDQFAVGAGLPIGGLPGGCSCRPRVPGWSN